MSWNLPFLYDENPPRYDPQFKMSTWIYRIALNVSISFYRKEQKRKKLTVTDTEALVKVKFEEIDAQDANVARLYAFINESKELDKALL